MKVYVCRECQPGCVLQAIGGDGWFPQNCPYGVSGGTIRQSATWELKVDVDMEEEVEYDD